MKKLVFSLFCTLALVGYVMADEFVASIKKVDGNNISYTKGKKDEQKDGKAEATADVKVFWAKGGGGKGGKGGGGGGAVEAGDAVENGLKNEVFTKLDEKGKQAQITTNDAGKITQIIVFKGGGKGGKKGGS